MFGSHQFVFSGFWTGTGSYRIAASGGLASLWLCWGAVAKSEVSMMDAVAFKSYSEAAAFFMTLRH